MLSTLLYPWQLAEAQDIQASTTYLNAHVSKGFSEPSEVLGSLKIT